VSPSGEPVEPEGGRERFRGSLLGLAAGDAVGTTNEFQPRGSFPPLTDMVGGGHFGLAPGQWTDDTSLALAAPFFDHSSWSSSDDQVWYWNTTPSTHACRINESSSS